MISKHLLLLIRLIFSLVLTFLAFTFNSCSQMSDQNVLNLLQERYQKEFIINHSSYSYETGLYHISASAVDNTDFDFSVEYNPKSHNLNSYFYLFLPCRLSGYYLHQVSLLINIGRILLILSPSMNVI